MQVILCCTISSVLAGSLDLAELIKRHEEGLGRIRSIKVEIELRISEDGGKTWKTTLEYSVMRNGERERYTAKHHYLPTSGYADLRILPAKSFTDVLTTPDGRRAIKYEGLMPGDIPSGTIDITELESTGRKIGGEIGPPQPLGPAGYKSPWLIPILFSADLRFTARELCAGSNPVPVGRTNARGEAVYELRITEPNRARTYMMVFDPSYNYMTSRIKNIDTKGKPLEWFADMSVIDFQEPKPGVFIPRTIRGPSGTNAGRVYEVVVSDAVVNEPFDDERLHHLEFPPGIIIVDNTSKEQTFHIWGEGGKPARTFHKLDDFRRWKIDSMASFSRKARHGGWGERVAWVAASTLVLLGVLYVRRLVARRLSAV